MSTATTLSSIQRGPELIGQTVVVIGGSAGIGLETARRARSQGAKLILTGRDPERLLRAASEVDALSTASFDAMDPAALERFFHDLPATIDHVMVTAGRPYYGRLVDMDFEQARRAPKGTSCCSGISAYCRFIERTNRFASGVPANGSNRARPLF